LDVAVLKRDSSGKGYVSFLTHQGLDASAECVETVFASTCPICNTNPMDPACQACFTPPPAQTSTPTFDGLNHCPKTTSYKNASVVDNITLEGTDNPVMILSTPASTKMRTIAGPSAMTGSQYAGFVRAYRSTSFVVLNRGGIDCFKDIRFRNTALNVDNG